MPNIYTVSNPKTAQRKLNAYLNKPTKLYISNRKDKKYYVYDNNNRKVHFGSIHHKDYTKTKDKTKRKAYLARASQIKGDWKYNKYSPNNLAMNVLW